MSDFDSGNSVNCVLFDINLYEGKRGNKWFPIPETITVIMPCTLQKVGKAPSRTDLIN